MAPRLRFLRPYSLQPLSPASSSQCATYLLFYELARASGVRLCHKRNLSQAQTKDAAHSDPEERSALVAARLKELRPAGGLDYPRFSPKGRSVSVGEFKHQFEEADEERLGKASSSWTLHGTV